MFHSDATDHANDFNHRLQTMKLPTGKSGRLEQFLDSSVTLNFRIEGKRVQMKISYRYYPRTRQVLYLDVAYSEPELRLKIEGNITMMRKVDLYFRSRADNASLSANKTKG